MKTLGSVSLATNTALRKKMVQLLKEFERLDLEDKLENIPQFKFRLSCLQSIGDVLKNQYLEKLDEINERINEIEKQNNKP